MYDNQHKLDLTETLNFFKALDNNYVVNSRMWLISGHDLTTVNTGWINVNGVRAYTGDITLYSLSMEYIKCPYQGSASDLIRAFVDIELSNEEYKFKSVMLNIIYKALALIFNYPPNPFLKYQSSMNQE